MNHFFLSVLSLAVVMTCLGCDAEPPASKESAARQLFYPEKESWGSVGWALEGKSQSGVHLSAELVMRPQQALRIFIESSNREGCRARTVSLPRLTTSNEEHSKALLRVEEFSGYSWIVVPVVAGDSDSCRKAHSSDKVAERLISAEALQKVMSAKVSIFQSYILPAESLEIYPDLSPSLNIGSRSILFRDSDTHSGGLGVIVDLETQEISGIAIDPEILNARAYPLHASIADLAGYQNPYVIHVDERDERLSRENSAVRCLFLKKEATYVKIDKETDRKNLKQLLEDSIIQVVSGATLKDCK